MRFVSRMLLFPALLVAMSCPVPVGAQERVSVGAEFKTVELDRFIEQEKKAVGKGNKLIRMAVPVSFAAKMKRQPEEKPLSYVYTAMEVAGVKPLPEVGHRMFVESGGGRIIPVYVEKQAAARLARGLKEEESARFLGYHLYSYAKGPAILVVDFVDAK